jgi:hypothetical protein
MATYKQRFNKKYGFDKDEPHSIEEIAKITKIKKSILDEVYKRGVGARKTNPESVRSLDGEKVGGKSLKGKMSAEQWSFARLYSFIMGGKTQSTTDKDLAIKAGLIKDNKRGHGQIAKDFMKFVRDNKSK